LSRAEAAHLPIPPPHHYWRVGRSPGRRGGEERGRLAGRTVFPGAREAKSPANQSSPSLYPPPRVHVHANNDGRRAFLARKRERKGSATTKGSRETSFLVSLGPFVGASLFFPFPWAKNGGGGRSRAYVAHAEEREMASHRKPSGQAGPGEPLGRGQMLAYHFFLFRWWASMPLIVGKDGTD